MGTEGVVKSVFFHGELNKFDSMDWLKGKPVGNHCFSPSNVGFSCKFSLDDMFEMCAGWYSSEIVSSVQGVVG